MTIIFLLLLVGGYIRWAPTIHRQHGAGGLWLLTAGASLVAALGFVAFSFALLDQVQSPNAHPTARVFFWPVLIAAGTGFALLALVVRRRQRQPERKTTWADLLVGLVVWAAGAVAGGAAAAGAGLLLLSGMAP